MIELAGGAVFQHVGVCLLRNSLMNVCGAVVKCHAEGIRGGVVGVGEYVGGFGLDYGIRHKKRAGLLDRPFTDEGFAR